MKGQTADGFGWVKLKKVILRQLRASRGLKNILIYKEGTVAIIRVIILKKDLFLVRPINTELDFNSNLLIIVLEWRNNS